MKNLVMGILMVCVFATVAMADVPTINKDNCVLTVTGSPTLDGWFMYITQNGDSIDVGFHPEQTNPETLIELNGSTMEFNLVDMGFECDDTVTPNETVSFDSVKVMYR